MTKEEKKRGYDKKYYEANKERVKEQHKQYREANKEANATYQKAYNEANKEKKKETHRDWMRANPDKVKQANARYRSQRIQYVKNRKDTDPAFKLMINLRVRQWQVLRGKQSTTKGLGCDSKFLKKHIEKQFTEGMSWSNYGHGEGRWCIDHIKPLHLLHTDPELISQLMHYTNLQPMWFIDNIKKGKKII